MNWLILLSGIIANSLASVLLKMSTEKLSSGSSIFSLINFSNWKLFLGLAFYALAFVIYIIALSRLPLNIAYPILTVGAIGLVTIFSFFLFGEKFNYSMILGLILMVSGVILVTQK